MNRLLDLSLVILVVGLLALWIHTSVHAEAIELPTHCPFLKNSDQLPEGAMVGSESAWPRPRWLDSTVDQQTQSNWRMAAVKYYSPGGLDVSIVSFYREGDCFKHEVGGASLISAMPIAIDDRVVVLALYPAGAASVTVKLFDPDQSTEPVIAFVNYGDRVSHKVEDGELIIEKNVRVESSDDFDPWGLETREIRYPKMSGVQ